MLSTSSDTGRLDHIDLSSEGLLARLRLSYLSLVSCTTSAAILLAIIRGNLILILHIKRKVLLRLTLGRRRMLLSTVISTRLVVLRGLDVWLRCLWLLILSTINNLFKVLPATCRA